MTHDPLCPFQPEQIGFGGMGSPVPSTRPYIPGTPCQCDLIARVREDERHKRETHGPYFNSVVHECCERVQTERGAALRDAVEAVKLSCSADIELVERSEVIAAIEALGGER